MEFSREERWQLKGYAVATPGEDMAGTLFHPQKKLPYGVRTIMSENKNLILAVVLCLIVLFGWGHFAEYMGWVAPPQQPSPEQLEKAEAARQEAASRKEAANPVFTPSPGRDFHVSTPLYEAVFYTGGGPLRSFMLKKYQAGILPDSGNVNLVNDKAAVVGPLGLVINSQPSWSTGQWTLLNGPESLDVAPGAQGSFTLVGQVDNLTVTRTFEIDASTYLIREKLNVANSSDHSRTVRVAFTTAMDKEMSTGQYDSMRIAWDNNGSLDDEDSAKTLETNGCQIHGNIYWAGPMSTYFIAAALPGDISDVTVKGRLANTVYRAAVEQEEFLLNPGEQRDLEVSYWLGPKVRSEMEAVSEQLVKSIDLGWFSFIGRILLWLLEFFQGYVHNWGIAIILLTLLIKAAFWPLTAKSYASMEKMKQLQPFMQTIREKYKGNREQMNKEVMALYKTYNVNPASGCVPILVQLPVFFGLYQALLSSIALRHASFITYLPGTHIIWLADLSAKDPLYITPIIMGITMFLQQRMSPPPADPTQAKIMMFLPLIFTVLFLNFPAGLVLYWLVNNILSILQQWLMIRKNRRQKPLAPVAQSAEQPRVRTRNK